MSIPSEARFIKSHEYVLPSAQGVRVGISAYAASQLGDVVYVELPAVGAKLTKGATFGVVESVKAVSDLYAPIDGEVIAVNEALTNEPGLVGDEPFGRGWMLELKTTAAPSGSEYMDPSAYQAFTGEH